MPKLSLNASKKTKHTPAGEIPVDWDYALLDQLAKRGSGHTPSKEFPSYWDGGIKWVSLADSWRLDRGYISQTTNEISEEGIRKSSAVLHPANTVILSRDAGVGKSAVLKEPMAVSQHFIAWTCGRHLDPWYLYYWLQQEKPFFERMAVGSTIKTIGLGVFKKLGGAFPPLPEQRRIADILSTCDRAIETLESLIAAKERRKQALMEQLLSGRKRLPGFKGKWGKVKLSELLTPIIRATAKPSSPFLAAGIRCHGRGVFLKPDFKPADIMLDELYEIQTNDLVVNITFAWEGAIAIVPEEANGALVSHRFPTYLFKQDLTCSEFFRHVIQTHGFVFECGLASPGGAGRNRVLSKKNFLKIAIPCPDLQEQQAIAAILDTADRELTLHRQHLATLRTQKRGLMGKLLTGAIRTPNK